MASKVSPWTNDEVQTFLTLVSDDKVQRGLDGMVRNVRIFQEVSEQMAAHGYHRSAAQCREKLKKLKADYRKMRDDKSRSGAGRRSWRWYDRMDAIYGYGPASSSNGGESGRESAALGMENGKRKRRQSEVDLPSLMDKMKTDEEQHLQQHSRIVQLLIDDAREARDTEVALRREEMAQNASFNQAFLDVLGQLVQAVSKR